MDTILLKDYVLILRKHFSVFLSFVLGCAIIAGLLTYLIPHSYTSSIDIYVTYKGTSSQNYYTYDGYYSTQASVGYADTVAGFLESLSTVSNAAVLVQSDPLYKEGGFTPVDLADEPNTLAAFQKNIDVAITAPQLVHVSVNDSSSVIAKLWAQSLGTVITDNLKQLNQSGDSDFTIDTIHAPITVTNQLSLALDIAIGLIVGIFLGFVAGFILEAYKK